MYRVPLVATFGVWGYPCALSFGACRCYSERSAYKWFHRGDPQMSGTPLCAILYLDFEQTRIPKCVHEKIAFDSDYRCSAASTARHGLNLEVPYLKYI